MTSFDFTTELKSTFNLLMRPETWLPTVTFTTGLSVPVAVTTCVKSPRVTAAVWYSGASAWPRLKYQTPPPIAATTATAMMVHLIQLRPGLSAINSIDVLVSYLRQRQRLTSYAILRNCPCFHRPRSRRQNLTL